MARTDLQVNFRMPAELKAKLEQAAKESGRSITSELVHRIEKSLNEIEHQDINTVNVSDQAINKIATKVVDLLNKKAP